MSLKIWVLFLKHAVDRLVSPDIQPLPMCRCCTEMLQLSLCGSSHGGAETDRCAAVRCGESTCWNKGCVSNGAFSHFDLKIFCVFLLYPLTHCDSRTYNVGFNKHLHDSYYENSCWPRVYTSTLVTVNTSWKMKFRRKTGLEGKTRKTLTEVNGMYCLFLSMHFT